MCSTSTVIKWTDAKAQGLKYYFTGYPCKNGHVDKRDVSDRGCYTCKLAKAALWKHKNPEKHAAANRKWSQENRASSANTQKKMRARDPKMYWARSTFQNARKRAECRGIPFDITLEYIYNLPAEVCPVFGTAFDFIGNGRICPESPSLDRIHPAKGYVVGNVVVISMKANTIKQNATFEEIQKVATWLAGVSNV